MALFNRSDLRPVICLTALGLTASLASLPASADVWVFEPSISLDQRFDDNYYLIPSVDGSLHATRLVGELGLSRESQATSYSGLVRIDNLLTTANDNGDEGLDSNQIGIFEAIHSSARSRYGFSVDYTKDTPSRDIAADLDLDSTNTNFDSTEFSNVGRQEIIIEPSYEYDLTRRLAMDTSLTFTSVKHDLPDAQDTIYDFYISSYPLNEDGSFDGTPLSYDEVTISNVGPFTPSGELDDYQETEADLGFRYKYTPITTLTATASYSYYTAEVEPDAYAIIPFEDLVSDPDEKDIRRKPKRDSISTTATFKIGFERSLTPNLLLGVDGGVYTNTTDLSDTLRTEDRPNEDITERQAALETDEDGWLASITLNYDAGVTRYTGKFAVDVVPSSSGSQVETNELIGTLSHIISPRLNLTVRASAYEPDRLGSDTENDYARRFISFQPKIEWMASRNWTVSAAYRYRRQKAQSDPVSAESNALLFALKYTPPSEVRDAAKANGL